MIDRASETGIGIIEKRSFTPKLLSNSEALNDARTNFASIPGLQEDQIERFVSEHVKTVRVGCVDVTIIDQEHEDFKGELNPVLLAYLNDPRTKTAVVEYFMPELQNNATNIPVIGSKAFEEITTLNKEGRGSMFMTIADIVKQRGKTVTCVDIANKLNYELYYAMVKGQTLPALSALFPQIPISPVDRLLLAAVLPMASWLVDDLLKAYGKGIYDKKKMSQLENFYISMEDARRIYAAKGLDQLAKDYNKEYPAPPGELNPRIVVVYPRAHAMRIADYMTEHSAFTKAAKAAKSFFYYLPNLDFSYRTYS